MSASIYTSPAVAPAPDVFLAGGISGTEEWQMEAARALANQGLVVADPRRPHMLLDPSLEPEQIRWEHDHLTRSAVILFWFPGPGDHPIAMYELGYWIGQDKPLVVGCPAGYKRRTNIETQVDLARPEVGPISDSLDEVIERVATLALAQRDKEK